jgi:hypothetical protein
MLLGGGELVTIVTGEQARAGGGRPAHRSGGEGAPRRRVVQYAGGQPHYPLLLGVE